MSAVAGLLVEQGVNFVVNTLEQEFNEAVNDFNQEFQEPGSFHEFLFELFTGMEATPIFDLDISATDPSILLLGSLGETRIAKFSDGEKAAFGTTAMGLSLEASTSAGFTFVNGVDSAFGTSVFVGVRGNAGNDMLTNAASGTVVLDGASGDDRLVSGVAGDVLVGGEGDDTLEGNEGHDTPYGSAGTDILLAGSGDDILFVDAADLSGTVDGGSGNDTLIITGGTGLAVTASDHNVEMIVGGDGNDTLRSGTTNGVTLRGGAGADILVGNAGAAGQSFGDKLFGGDGNDILRSGSSGSDLDIDELEGGLGNDRIEITGLLDDRVFDEGGNDRLVLPTLQALTTFVREGNHMAIQNGTTQIVIFDWFVSPDHKIETIEFADGSTITAAQAEGLASQPPPDCGDPFCGFGFPVVLDLDGDGLELTSAADSRVRFDMDGDGVRDRTGWIGRDDGFLVFDENGNGRVDGVDEIGFTRFAEGARTDLEGLRAFDTDGDGLFSAGDEAYGAFRIWRDANGNGRSERHELLTLEEMGIESLDLAGHLDATVMNGNAVLGRTSFTRTDGTTGEAGDVALQFAPRPDPAAEAASAAALLRLTQAMAAFDPGPAGMSDLRRAGQFDERVHLAPSLMAGRDYLERHAV